MRRLPIVVVLPTPLTPTNIHTFGLSGIAGSKVSDRSEPSRRATISAWSPSSSAAGSVISLQPTFARNRSRSSVGDPDADVGAQQRLFEVFEALLGDGAAAEYAGERAGEGESSLRQAITQRRRLERLGLDELFRSLLDEGARSGITVGLGRRRSGRSDPRRRRCGTTGVASADHEHADPEHDHEDREDQKDDFDTHRQTTLSVMPDTHAQRGARRPGHGWPLVRGRRS